MRTAYAVFHAEAGHLRSHLVGVEVRAVRVDFEYLLVDSLDEGFGGAPDGILEDLLGRAVFVDYAFIHEEYPGAHVACEFHFVGDYEHCHAFFGQLTDNAEHFSYHSGVKCRCGLVEQNCFRLHGKGPCNCNTLLLSAGEVVRIDIGLVGHSHLFQEFEGFFPGLLFRDFEKFYWSKYHVLDDSHVGEKVEVLENHPHFSAELVQRISFCHDVLSVYPYFSSGWRVKHVESPEEGAFSCPGRTDDADNLSRADVAVYVSEDIDYAAVGSVE